MSELELKIKLTGEGTGLTGTVRQASDEFDSLGTKASAGGKKAASGVDEISKSVRTAANDFSRLEQELDPSIANTQKLQAAADVLDKEYKAGNITLERHAQLLELSNRKYKQVRGSMVNTRMASQQLGYQVQDMAVQLQMGVNPMVALGQQGSQLVSIFGPGGALLGAVLAIGAAVSTAFASSFSDASEEIDAFEARYESLVSNLNSVQIRQVGADIKLIEERLQETETIYNTAMMRRERTIDIFDKALKSEYELAEQQKANAKELEDIRLKAYNDMIDAEDALFAAKKKLSDLQKTDNDKADENRQESINKYIESLKDEANTLGMNVVQMSVYRAEKLKMSEQEKETVKQLAESIQQKKDLSKAEEDSLKSLEKANQEYQRSYQREMKKGLDLTLSMMTPIERFDQQMSDLFDLYQKGAIDLETFNRAEAQYANDVTGHLSRIKNAVDRTSASFEDTWVDAMKTGKLSIEDFANTFIEQVIRMQYQATIGNAVNAFLQTVFSGISNATTPSVTPGAAPAPASPATLSARGTVPATTTTLASRSAAQDTNLASTSSAVTIHNYNDFSNVSSFDESRLQKMLDERDQKTKADIFNQMNRGGAASKISGRR